MDFVYSSRLKKKEESMILAGDIGATHTRLSLYDGRKLIQEEVFFSKEYSALIHILREFLKEHKNIKKAVFGIAGPIKDGKCKATNLPWFIDSKELSEELRIPDVVLINDLLANAYGIRVLNEDEFYILNRGEARKGNACLISAGTGLGEAGLYWDDKALHPFATEGGHSDFAPADKLQCELLHYLQGTYGHVSYERILSGPGISDLYHFLRDVKKENPLPGPLTDLPPLISSKAIEKTSIICEKTMHLFVSIYGREAGNLALKILSLGGVYIGGGIAPRILPLLKSGLFMESFLAKGRFKDLLHTIPVKVILNEKTALLGALEYALLKN